MEFIEPLVSQLRDMAQSAITLLPQLSLGFIVLFLTWGLAALLSSLMFKAFKRSKLRNSLKSLFTTLVRLGVWVIGTVIAITIIFPSITPAKLLAGLGLGSVAIGFAFKDVLENFLAGVMIMLRKPMRIGDFIECEDISGKVEHIAIRDTFLRRTDQQLVMVPNGMLYKNPVRVITDKDLRRFEIIAGVSYDTDLQHAHEVIDKAMSTVSKVDRSKPVEIYATEFNASSVDFRVRWWSKSAPLDEHQSRDEVIRAIKSGLDEAGIEIPFPYRTLTFKEPLSLKQQQGRDIGSKKERKAA